MRGGFRITARGHRAAELLAVTEQFDGKLSGRSADADPTGHHPVGNRRDPTVQHRHVFLYVRHHAANPNFVVNAV